MTNFLYESAKKEILHMIKSGYFLTDKKIYTERKFAELLGYNRMTIRRALSSLENDGLVQRKPGDGTYLNNKKIDIINIGYKSPISLSQQCQIKRITLSNIVKSFKVVYDNEKVNNIFNNEFHEFYELKRIRMGDGEIIAYQISYFPFRLFQDAHRYDFSVFSLYDYMGYQNNKPQKFKRKLRTIDTSDHILKDMNLNTDSPIDLNFLFDFYGYTEENRLVEYTRSYYKSDFISYKVKFKY